MTFTIRKNHHWSNRWLYKLINIININSRLYHIIVMDKSCLYNMSGPDKEDVNKLFGFSLGINHHRNSARFGWNSSDDKINIYAYCYDNGNRISKFIRTISVDKEYRMGIKDYDKYYLFTIISDDYERLDQVKIYKSKRFCFGFKLWPYFGGNKRSPKTMLITME